MNFSPLSARKRYGVLSLVAALALCSGCGPDDGSDALGEGRAAAALGDHAKAGRCYLKSVTENPANVDAWVELAVTREALGEIPAAREAIDRAAELAPDDVDVRLVAAQVAFYEKDFEGAERRFRAIADDLALDKTVRADAWAGAGVALMAVDDKHVDEARVAFLRALNLDFRNAAARYHLGMLYQTSFGFDAAALEQFSIFVRLKGAADGRMQRVQRAVIPDLKGNRARQLAEIPGASRRDSAACAKFLAQADELAKAGKNEAARAKYEEAFKADPLSYPAALGLARCWAKSAPSKKRGAPDPRERALDAYQAVCRLNPIAGNFLAAADLAVQLGRHATAVRLYSMAVAAEPTKLDAIDGLIRQLRKAGRSQTAAVYQEYRDSIKKVTVRR